MSGSLFYWRGRYVIFNNDKLWFAFCMIEEKRLFLEPLFTIDPPPTSRLDLLLLSSRCIIYWYFIIHHILFQIKLIFIFSVFFEMKVDGFFLNSRILQFRRQNLPKTEHTFVPIDQRSSEQSARPLIFMPDTQIASKTRLASSIFPTQNLISSPLPPFESPLDDESRQHALHNYRIYMPNTLYPPTHHCSEYL